MIILCCCDSSLPVAVIHSDQVKLVAHFSDKLFVLICVIRLHCTFLCHSLTLVDP